MKWLVALLLPLLAVPTAAAFTVETDPPADTTLDVGPFPRDLEILVPVTVWVNCTLGDAAFDGVELVLEAEPEEPLTAAADPPQQATEGPSLCAADADDIRFEGNVTLAWTSVFDATKNASSTVSFRVSHSFGTDSGSWTFDARQAFDPAVEVSLPEGFEYEVAPDKAFAIPVRVHNGGNAPVRASVDVRTLGPYEAQSVRAPPPQTIDWLDSRPQEARLVVVGHTHPAVGNLNRTIVLEIRVEVAPLDVEFAEFHTIRRLFVAHVQVKNQHLRSVDGGAASDVGAVFVTVAAAVAAAVLRHSGPTGGRR